MGKNNKSYRIRTTINQDAVVHVNFDQTFEKFEILSLTLDQTNAYRLMASNTGVVAGRVLANGGFGVPNAKVSVFVPYDGTEDMRHRLLYQFTTPQDTYGATIKYNLLPSESNDACHQNVGTFPTKRIVLDNQDWVEIFDKYYKYTTKTNNAGDYMIYGVPVGMQQIHMDVDLSDIGILSQTPRDMMYKGYSANLFDSPTKFKKDTNLTSLVQIMSKDNSVYVYPFWGDTTNTSTNAAITRCDFNLDYKFEPTCIFMGSVITDTGENSLSKRCVAAKGQGKMSELVTGEGRIEMIRKTYDGKVEQYSVQGDKVINENGVWCYQIPMNLDYIITDEFGNMVLSDNPDKGIPTRTRVRFRVNMADSPGDRIARKRARYLIPNNPHICKDGDDTYPEFTSTKLIDYEFGSKTKNENFRDLMWNNVYTVKNYIPRLQKSRLPNNLRHLGIKMVNHSGDNNPMPFNNLRIKFNFTYMFLCTLMKIIVMLTGFVNRIITGISVGFYKAAVACVNVSITSKLNGLGRIFAKLHSCKNGEQNKWLSVRQYIKDDCVNLSSVDEDSNDPKEYDDSDTDEITRGVFLRKLCQNPQVGVWDFNTADGAFDKQIGGLAAIFLVIVKSIHCGIVLENICETDDGEPIDLAPGLKGEIKRIWDTPALQVSCGVCNDDVKKAYNCIENQLAQDNEVTSFNFYNDWVNGVLYFPLWYRRIKPKRKILGVTWKEKDQYCANDNTLVPKRKYEKKMKLYNTMVPKREFKTAPTANSMGELKPLEDDSNQVHGDFNDKTYLEYIQFNDGYKEINCYGYRCHKYSRMYQRVKTGIIYEKETMLGDRVQYYKPVYYQPTGGNTDTITLFATDIVLLGSLHSCDIYGIPQFFKALTSTTYNMPPDLLVEDYDTDESNDNKLPNAESDSDTDTETRTNQKSEFTGADWGDLGCDQSGDRTEDNTTVYDNGGLFYGLTCFNHYTKPKSCINLPRICELGISLDESQDILDMKAVNELTPRPKSEDDLELYTKTLTPDGFISYDEIYDMDYRSMFATMNNNFLKTKYNPNTGRIEYDFKHLYVDNFDGSLYDLMQAKTVNGVMCNNNGERNSTGQKPNYTNNYNLEKSSDAYLNFRYGNYYKQNGKKIYFYDYAHTVGGRAGVTAENRQPRYENSFYFYFGLKEGSTALDKFNTEYFSDCVTDSAIEPAYNVTFQGNSWCPIDSSDGYIAFDVNMDTPITVTLTNVEDSDEYYVIRNATKERFYIGNSANAPSGYAHYTWYNNSNVEVANINTCIPTRQYNIVFVDGNGNEYTDEITFEAPRVNYIADPFSFTCKNSDLESRFAVLDGDNQIDWGATFKAIANRGGVLDPTHTRDIGGYITVSDIDEDITHFKISLTPVNAAFFYNNPNNPDPDNDYTGCEVVVEDGVITYTGDGYLGVDGDVYSFGVPYANQKYKITVTQICDATGEEDESHDSGNSTSVVVTVSEMLLKMYINDVDYDNIRNFKTSWNETGVTYSGIQNMTPVQGIYDPLQGLYGWNDVENIGKYYFNGQLYPVEPFPLSPTSAVDLDRFIALGNVLTDDYDGNGMSYIVQGNDCSTPYTWTEDYCINAEWWNNIINQYGNITCTRVDEQTDTEEIINLHRIPLFSEGEYQGTHYKDEDNNTVFEEDTDGILTDQSTSQYTYSEFSGLTTHDFISTFEDINNTINNRIEFTKHLRGNMRIGKDGTVLSVTYRSNEPPIEYQIIGCGEDLDENTQTYHLGTQFILDPDNKEENQMAFTIATLEHDYVQQIYRAVQDLARHKYPYYVAIKDNNDIAIPSESISDGINNFAVQQTGYPNCIRIDKMFGVHFYNTPLYLSFNTIWHPLDNMPLYVDSVQGTQGVQYITMDGFATGYCNNSLSVQTSRPQIFNNNHEVGVTQTARPSSLNMSQLICGTQGIYGEYVFTTQYPDATNYQYTQIQNGENSFTVNDGYGNPCNQVVSGNSITFDGTKLMYPHKYYIQADDKICVSLTNTNIPSGTRAQAHLFVYNDPRPTTQSVLIYPLNEVQNIGGQYKYTVTPEAYEYDTNFDYHYFNCIQTVQTTLDNSPLEITIPTIQGVQGSPYLSNFFVIMEYQDKNNVNNRLISPVIETANLRCISNVDINNFSGDFTPDKQTLYITPRIAVQGGNTTTCQHHYKMTGDYDIANMQDIKNVYNYPFTVSVRDGESVIYEQTVDLNNLPSNVTVVNQWYTDWCGHNRMGDTVSWNINAIKITIPETTIDMVAGQRVWITDVTGIQFCCGFTQDGTMATESQLNAQGWTFTDVEVN